MTEEMDETEETEAFVRKTAAKTMLIYKSGLPANASVFFLQQLQKNPLTADRLQESGSWSDHLRILIAKAAISREVYEQRLLAFIKAPRK